MGKFFTGLTPATPDNLLLDAGAFFKGYIVGTDTPATATAKLLGATSGGGAFSAVPTVRKIEVDGAKGNVKGLQVIDDWTVTMTANAKEVTVQNIALALGAATLGTATDGYQKITGKCEIEDSDYVDNITWIGKLKGSDTPVIIVLNNALSMNGLTLTFTDKTEAIIALTLTGNYDLEDLETPPFAIYYPQAVTEDE